jgi:hypothetical protein
MSHFHGKTVPEHLKEARKKGALASAETHGVEMAGSKAAFIDSCKECALLLLLLMILSPSWIILCGFSLGLIFWKTGRSALLGFSRLERLHRVLEEERFEIANHRGQERAELIELYRAKGFQGKLLDEAVDTLMADDNRLLTVMLEEELGFSLKNYEHPLKQACGALLGSLLSCAALAAAYLFSISIFLSTALVLIGLSALLAAKLEKSAILPKLVWNLSIALGAAAFAYYYV